MVTNESLKACVRTALGCEAAHSGIGRMVPERVGALVRAEAEIVAELFGATWTESELLVAVQDGESKAERLNRESPPNP